MSKGSKDSRLVFSTDGSHLAGQAVQERHYPGSADGLLRLQREKQGRGGKWVMRVQGVKGSAAELKALLKQLKQRMGAGGSLDEGDLILQGDQLTALGQALNALGYRIKGFQG